jgi:hypothetical protein
MRKGTRRYSSCTSLGEDRFIYAVSASSSGSGRCEVPVRAAFALMLLLSGEIAAHHPRDPSPTKARRRGGGRSAPGPPVYLTEASWGAQDWSTLPEDSPLRESGRSVPRPVSTFYTALL